MRGQKRTPSVVRQGIEMMYGLTSLHSAGGTSNIRLSLLRRRRERCKDVFPPDKIERLVDFCLDVHPARATSRVASACRDNKRVSVRGSTGGVSIKTQSKRDETTFITAERDSDCRSSVGLPRGTPADMKYQPRGSSRRICSKGSACPSRHSASPGSDDTPRLLVRLG